MYIDRLVAFIEEKYGQLQEDFKQGIKVAGMMIHMLLFADDIVLISGTARGVERLLTLVGDFCDANELVVSTAKTKCLYVLGKASLM